MAAKKSKSFLVSSSMASLPDEILISHVFVRLSVRSLSHCKCVCKQWNRFLIEPHFIAMHLKHQKIHNNQNFLCGPVMYKPALRRKDDRAKARALYGVYYSVHLQSTEAVAVRLPGFPLLLKNYIFCQTVCYCNGIVCILVDDNLEKDMTKSKHLLFGNPSTGDYKVLPDPVPTNLLIGFTYDSSVDDYLCVMVDNITRNPHIYSLKLNSWRTNLGSSDKCAIECEIYDGHNVGVALDRSIYWANRSSNFIVEFDFKDEEFRELPLPTEMPKTNLSVKVVGGSVCVMNMCFVTGKADMWLMSKQEEEEENKKAKCCCSWSKLMTLDIWFSSINPMSFTRDGKVLCHVQESYSKNSFVVIDPKTQIVEDLTVPDETGSDWLEVIDSRGPHMGYIDTLISPN